MLLMVNAALPVFLIVKVRGALAVPSAWLLKERAVGDKLAARPVAMPLPSTTTTSGHAWCHLLGLWQIKSPYIPNFLVTGEKWDYRRARDFVCSWILIRCGGWRGPRCYFQAERCPSFHRPRARSRRCGATYHTRPEP